MNPLASLIYALEHPEEFEVVVRNGELTFTPIATRDDPSEKAEFETTQFNRLPITRLETAIEMAL